MANISQIKLPDGTIYSVKDNISGYVATEATTSAKGLMSASDKTKLNGIASGAEVNQNAFSNVTVGTTTVAADSKTDTLTLEGGANITLTPDATNDKITISLDDTVDTGEVIATDIQAGNLIVNGSARFLNTINGTASNSEKLNGQSLTSTYSSTGTAPITGAAVASAIAALDGTVTGSPSASKTLTAFSQTDGKVSAKFENISITKSQVSDFPTLGTAAAKNYTTSVTNGSADLVTSGAVWTAIDNLPEPMVFKGSLGTGGTITALPVDGSASIGDTYKVIEAKTYAGKAAKIGDTFICLTKTSSANTWELIPSGDEPSGTVTSVAILNGGGLSVSGSPITSSGTITISHADTSSQASVNNSGRTYIQDITLDTYGHVTGITSATETVVNTDRYVNSAAFADATSADANNPVKMTLTRAGSDTASVTAYIPKVSSSSAGVVPKGATVSSQSQSTKFLREDGTWAAPSYTTNTNTTYTLGTSGNTVTLTPSSGSAQSITVPYATSAGSATDNTKLPLAGGTMTGQIVLASNGYRTYNAAGYSVDQHGNFTHLGTTTSDYWHLDSNNGTRKFSVYWETGDVTAAGTITASKFIGVSEADLQWGGKNFSGSYGCIDACLMDELGANRFQFIKADAITVEYSRDAGTTWTDYGASNAQKQQIFAQGGGLVIGKADSTHKATEHPGEYQLRITIDTGIANVYSYLNKFVIYVSTNNSGDCSCKIQKALQSTPTTFIDHTDWVSVTGWSGYNVINTSNLVTYGNTPSSQYGRVRFIFKDSTSTGTSYNGLTVYQIKAFGGVGWSTPSTMAKTGHLYAINENQDATFPANVTATKFIGALQGNADTATTATNLSGFTNTTTTATAINDATQNGHVFVNGTSDIYGYQDGACFIQAYSTSWVGQIYQDYRSGQIALRGKSNGTWQAWRKVLDSSNYTNYTVQKNGTGASGTWGISISGSATSIKTEGDNRSTATTPNDYVDKLIFRGLKNASAIGSPGGGSGYSYLVGLRGWGDSSGGDAHELAFNNNGIYCRHGATTTWGDWSKIFTSADIYTGTLTSSQVTTALGFTPTANTGTITSVKTTAGTHTTINVSSGAANFNVPTKTSHLTNDSGYVTTDTKNTAGSTDTSSKIYLVGATSQAANPQTYSDNEVFTTSGVLTTKSIQVGGGAATMEYSATTKSINFVFAS